MPTFVLSRAFIVFLFPSPHTLSLGLRPPFGPSISVLLGSSKFDTRLRFIDGSKPCLQHLQAHVAPEETSPDIDCANNSAILICFIDVRAHAPAIDVCSEPIKRFLPIRLSRPSKMSQFRGVDSGEADVNLALVSLSASYLCIARVPFDPSALSCPRALAARGANPSLPVDHQVYGTFESCLHLPHL